MNIQFRLHFFFNLKITSNLGKLKKVRKLYYGAFFEKSSEIFEIVLCIPIMIRSFKKKKKLKSKLKNHFQISDEN